ncbi:MAG: S8 family serine peptidase [Sedimentisphaerales bacterium]|nr:S8 family serine peptidase [Sedimentisphaerales bacterium]
MNWICRSSRGIPFWTGLAIGLVLAVLVMPGSVWAVLPGQTAPDFTLTGLDGLSYHLAAEPSQDRLLIFGSLDCDHCQKVLSALENPVQLTGGSPIAIWFVAVRQTAAELKARADLPAGELTILPDPTGRVAEQYRINRTPAVVFVDADGIVRYQGNSSARSLFALLRGERPELPALPADRFAEDVRNQANPAGAPARKTERLIVELDEPEWFSQTLVRGRILARQRQLDEMVSILNGRIIHNYGKWKNRIVVEMPAESADQLAQLPGLKRFYRDTPVHALLEDSIPQIHADYAWNNAITGQGVTICVVDTGVDYNHPDLQNKVVAQYDFTSDVADAMDDNGHGTHCAGIIASTGPVYRGVSYDVSLMAAKVLDFQGSGFASDVILGIQWAVAQGADVISLSLGEGQYADTCDLNDMAQAVNEAVAAGVVVVCASGNDENHNALVAPACASQAIAVGAVDKNDHYASYTNGGAELDLVAPGGDGYTGGTNFPEIISTYSTAVANDPLYCLYYLLDECYDPLFVVDGTRYIRAVGTSMATPHVAGAAALLLEKNPYLSPAQIRSVLQDNADDLGDIGWDNIYGWGRINLERALDNLPVQPSELRLTITDPNVSRMFYVDQPFPLEALVSCYGQSGCGTVQAIAEFGPDTPGETAEYQLITGQTDLATLDANPADLGILSGLTIQTVAGRTFDVQTSRDISLDAYSKIPSPLAAEVGSTMPTSYDSGDLEPLDGIGAIGADAQKLYSFFLPAGSIESLQVRLEHYLVLQLDWPGSGWYLYTSNAAGEPLHLVGDCQPEDGGGGTPAPPDCWFVSQDPDILADLQPGQMNYLLLSSHDVGPEDWLTFNDLQVLVDYQLDPDNDQVHRYTVQFDLAGVDPAAQVTAAYLELTLNQAAAGGLGEIYLADPAAGPADAAESLYLAEPPTYTNLINPIKTFAADTVQSLSVNLKTAVAEALQAGQDRLTLQIRQHNEDRIFHLDAGAAPLAAVLTIHQKDTGESVKAPGPDPATPPTAPSWDGDTAYPPDFDALCVRETLDDTYSSFVAPAAAPVGAEYPSEYSTGDLEPENAIGAIGADAQKLYSFEIPAGSIQTLKVRLAHYLVLHMDNPNAAWSVYTSNATGDMLHLVDTIIPADGGGGATPPPDSWFISQNPTILADIAGGQTNYLLLRSQNVGANDWLTFNEFEVLIDYQIGPEQDSVHRYYLRFDISDLSPDSQIDTARLFLYVRDAGAEAVGQVRLVDPSYDAGTGALTLFNAEDAPFSNLINPIASFAAGQAGWRYPAVKAALEDAVASGAGRIAFQVTEAMEDQLFSLDGAGGEFPPSLEVLISSGVTGGTAHWQIVPGKPGRYRIRVRAESSLDVDPAEDTITLTILDPNVPFLGTVDCLINGQWQDCRQAGYGDTLEVIRIEATDQQEIPQVQVKLTNLPDDRVVLAESAAYDGGVFVSEPNLTITDSGDWRLEVTAGDSDNHQTSSLLTWLVPWGRLSSQLLEPAGPVSAAKSSLLDVTTRVDCLEAECPPAGIYPAANPSRQRVYDNGTAESYGDIGDAQGYIAAKIKPQQYPARLQTARFYVYDETTYPFELHVWDDNGSAGKPGTELMAPRVVDPVVPSRTGSASDGHPETAIPQVAWFDVDLSDQNIVITDGSFYIGWRQILTGQNNQVGFDMDGQLERNTWGYLPDQGWFALEDYCQFCFWFPEFCEFCGNIMIRALLAEPGTYAGLLPETAQQGAPLYADRQPAAVTANLKAGQGETASFAVRCVGAVGDHSPLYTISQNPYSRSESSAVTVTITEAASPCRAANLDARDLVDMADYAVLASQWLSSPMHRVADIDDDGDIDLGDLQLLLEHWLEDCPP